MGRLLPFTNLLPAEFWMPGSDVRFHGTIVDFAHRAGFILKGELPIGPDGFVARVHCLTAEGKQLTFLDSAPSGTHQDLGVKTTNWAQYVSLRILEGCIDATVTFDSLQLRDVPFGAWYWNDFFNQAVHATRLSSGEVEHFASIPESLAESAEVVSGSVAADVQFRTVASVSKSETGIAYRLNTHLTFKFAKPAATRAVVELLHELKAFSHFLFATDELGGEIFVRSSTGTDIEVHDQVLPVSDMVDGPYDLKPILLRTAGASLPAMLRNWIQRSDDIYDAVKYLLEGITGTPSTDISLGVQSLEGLHRRWTGVKELTLKARLNQLAQMLPATVRRRVLTQNHGPYINRLVETRDYVSHGKGIHKALRFSEDEERHAASCVIEFVRALVLLKLDVPPAAVEALFAQRQTLFRYFLPEDYK